MVKAQHSLGHDQYRKTLDKAITILNAETFDKNYKQKLADKKKAAEKKDPKKGHKPDETERNTTL